MCGGECIPYHRHHEQSSLHANTVTAAAVPPYCAATVGPSPAGAVCTTSADCASKFCGNGRCCKDNTYPSEYSCALGCDDQGDCVAAPSSNDYSNRDDEPAGSPAGVVCSFGSDCESQGCMEHCCADWNTYLGCSTRCSATGSCELDAMDDVPAQINFNTPTPESGSSGGAVAAAILVPLFLIGGIYAGMYAYATRMGGSLPFKVPGIPESTAKPAASGQVADTTVTVNPVAAAATTEAGAAS